MGRGRSSTTVFITRVEVSVGIGARKVLTARPSLARTISRLSGAAMVAIGVLLLVHQLAG